MLNECMKQPDVVVNTNSGQINIPVLLAWKPVLDKERDLPKFYIYSNMW